MSDTILVNDVVPAKSRQTELLECETRILRAGLTTVQSILVIGTELRKIKDGELWELHGHDSFDDYVQSRLKMDVRLAQQWMRSSKALEVLDQQKLQLPYSQSQVVELSKLRTPEIVVGVWQAILSYCTEKRMDITLDLVKKAVIKQRTKSGERTTRAPRVRKVQPPKGLDIDLDGVGAPPSKERLWSEDGERALNRIRALCGDSVADALDQGTVKISEHDLIDWSQQDDPELIKNLSYWIVFKDYSYRKARAYEEEIVTDKTSVAQLADLARSRGGRVHVKYMDLSMTLVIEAIADK